MASSKCDIIEEAFVQKVNRLKGKLIYFVI